MTFQLLDRWFVGGLLGGTALFTGLPQLAATEVLTAINTAIGLGGFGVQISLASLIPSGATLSLPTVGAALLPSIAGFGVTIAVIVGAARRAGGGS